MSEALLFAWFALNGVPVPIREAARHLPPYSVAVAGKKLAEQCQAKLKLEMEFAPSRWPDLWPLYQEAGRRAYLWSLLASIQNRGHTDEYRRAALERLRRELSEDDFWNGRMPCPFVEAALWGD
jgi:hypothetical protein